VAVEIVYETHATTVDNEAGYATGWRGAELSERGRAEAVELGERRRDDNLAAVFCSDLEQAVQTVAIAFEGARIPVYFDARLRECDYGLLNGAPKAELHGAGRHRFLRNPHPNGESWLIALDRVDRALDDLRQLWPGGTIVLIGHIATRWALLRRTEQVTLEELAEEDFAWQPGWTFRLP